MLASLVVSPGSPADLERRDPRDPLELPGKEESAAQLDALLDELASEEQRDRFAERLSDPAKRWKYNPKDEATSRRFAAYTAAYDECLTATSTEASPWYVIPADRNWVRNLAVATVLVAALRRLDPQFPDSAA